MAAPVTAGARTLARTDDGSGGGGCTVGGRTVGNKPRNNTWAVSAAMACTAEPASGGVAGAGPVVDAAGVDDDGETDENDAGSGTATDGCVVV